MTIIKFNTMFGYILYSGVHRRKIIDIPNNNNSNYYYYIRQRDSSVRSVRTLRLAYSPKHRHASARTHAHTLTSAHVPLKYYLRRDIAGRTTTAATAAATTTTRRRRRQAPIITDLCSVEVVEARRFCEASFSFGGVTGGALCACTTPPSCSAWPAVRALGGALLPFIDQWRRRRRQL